MFPSRHPSTAATRSPLHPSVAALCGARPIIGVHTATGLVSGTIPSRMRVAIYSTSAAWSDSGYGT